MAIILLYDSGERARDSEMADFEFRHRVFVGLCVAVHVPVVMALMVMALVLFATSSGKSDYGLMSSVNLVITVFAATYMIVAFLGGITAVVFGIPFVLLCRRLGWESCWSFAAGGALFGVPAAMVIDYYFLRDSSVILQGLAFQDLLLSRASALGALCGALSALAFWSIAYRWAPAQRRNELS